MCIRDRVVADPGSITQLVEDDHGNIWIGTTSRLFFKQAGSKKIAELSFDISHISDMSKDSKGNVWIASRDAIYQMAYENKPILLKHYPKESMPLSDAPIVNICANARDVWFSTSLGRLLRFDSSEEKMTDETEACGLTGDNILKILLYKDKIWIVCDKYIIRHHPATKENTAYFVNDPNIFVSSFRHSAAFVDEEGCLYAGGHNGFIKILPDRQNTNNKRTGQVLITDVKSDNRSVLF